MGFSPFRFRHGGIHVCMRAIRQGAQEWELPILLDWRHNSACLAGDVSRYGGLVGLVSSVVLGTSGVLGAT